MVDVTTSQPSLNNFWRAALSLWKITHLRLTNWGCACNNRLGARLTGRAEGGRDLWLVEISFLKNASFQRLRFPSIRPTSRVPRRLLHAHPQFWPFFFHRCVQFVQLTTVDIRINRFVPWKQLKKYHTFPIPPNRRHNLFLMQFNSMLFLVVYHAWTMIVFNLRYCKQSIFHHQW